MEELAYPIRGLVKSLLHLSLYFRGNVVSG